MESKNKYWHIFKERATFRATNNLGMGKSYFPRGKIFNSCGISMKDYKEMERTNIIPDHLVDILEDYLNKEKI